MLFILGEREGIFDETIGFGNYGRNDHELSIWRWSASHGSLPYFDVKVGSICQMEVMKNYGGRSYSD